jgi:hypothetical protein
MRFPRGTLVYLATPYTAYVQGHLTAYVRAAKLAAALLREGVSVYSPIAHMHPLAEFGRLDLADRNLWRDLDDAILGKADMLLVAHLDGWDASEGIAHEVDAFAAAGKRIVDLDPRTLAMAPRDPHAPRIAAVLPAARSERAGAP